MRRAQRVHMLTSTIARLRRRRPARKRWRVCKPIGLRAKRTLSATSRWCSRIEPAWPRKQSGSFGRRMRQSRKFVARATRASAKQRTSLRRLLRPSTPENRIRTHTEPNIAHRRTRPAMWPAGAEQQLARRQLRGWRVPTLLPAWLFDLNSEHGRRLLPSGNKT